MKKNLLLCLQFLCIGFLNAQNASDDTTIYNAHDLFAQNFNSTAGNSFRSAKGIPGALYWQNSASYLIHAALSEKDCAATFAYGMEAIAGGCDLLCIGEMGIGNTTIAAALAYGLFGGTPEQWVGPGTGVDADGVKRKADAIRRAVELHKSHLQDPLEVLRRLGGRELAAMAGAILAARMERVPVLIDGYVATAAAAVLFKLDPQALDHCIAAHCSAEPAHRKLLEKIGKSPLLDLGMRLGEASGAALAAGIVKAAVNCHNQMATFASAGVANKE